MENPNKKAPFTLLMGDIWDKVGERSPQPPSYREMPDIATDQLDLPKG
jgi:hypothetical protein